MHGDPENSLKDGGCAGIILNTVAKSTGFCTKRLLKCFPECENDPDAFTVYYIGSCRD